MNEFETLGRLSAELALLKRALKNAEAAWDKMTKGEQPGLASELALMKQRLKIRYSEWDYLTQEQQSRLAADFLKGSKHSSASLIEIERKIKELQSLKTKTMNKCKKIIKGEKMRVVEDNKQWLESRVDQVCINGARGPCGSSRNWARISAPPWRNGRWSRW